MSSVALIARSNWKGLADNYEKSVFYQLDLQDAAKKICPALI